MQDVILVCADMEIIELIEENSDLNLIGIADIITEPVNNYNYQVLGSDQDVVSQADIYRNVSVIISIDDVSIREKLYCMYKKAGFEFCNLISKDSCISRYTQIENKGIIIQRGVNVGPNVGLGKCVKVNVNANIMHDAVVGDFSTIAPNAVVLGYVQIGNNVFVGANSTILPRIEVADVITIGAGSVVTKNLDKEKVYAGNPARELIR